MNNLAKMSIDEIEELLSRVTDPTSASPAEAVLQSKSIRFLSSEIAILKEALCLQTEKMQKSNEKLSKSNEKLSRINLCLTAIIALAALIDILLRLFMRK
ncbi:MAG: hypothetical protein WC532_07390 [Candidatus Omnitrophota bacterium]